MQVFFKVFVHPIGNLFGICNADETLKTIAKETDAETKSMKSVAIPVNHLFGGEEYVKVKKSDWNKIMDAFSRAVSRNHLLEKYEKKISALEKKIETLTDQIEKLKQFVASRGNLQSR